MYLLTNARWREISLGFQCRSRPIELFTVCHVKKESETKLRYVRLSEEPPCRARSTPLDRAPCVTYREKGRCCIVRTGAMHFCGRAASPLLRREHGQRRRGEKGADRTALVPVRQDFPYYATHRTWLLFRSLSAKSHGKLSPPLFYWLGRFIDSIGDRLKAKIPRIRKYETLYTKWRKI